MVRKTKTVAAKNPCFEMQDVIKSFAEKHGIEIAKAKQFVISVIEQITMDQPEEQPAPQEIEVDKAPVQETRQKKETGERQAHRPLSSESERVRRALLVMRHGLANKPITAVELAEQLNTNINTINNNLRFLNSQGLVEPAGRMKRVGRGKAPTLWKFHNAV